MPSPLSRCSPALAWVFPERGRYPSPATDYVPDLRATTVNMKLVLDRQLVHVPTRLVRGRRARPGLVERREAPGRPLRVEYRLSVAGARLLPVIGAMGDFRADLLSDG